MEDSPFHPVPVLLGSHRRKEGKHLQHLRVFFRNAARTHVKTGILVQAADGGTVGAFHVVGVDFQLGSRLNMGTFRQEDIVVFLIVMLVIKLISLRRTK